MSQLSREVSNLRKKNSAYWQSIGHRNALRLFHAASSRVPAYKDFLQKNHVRPSNIKTWKDFQEVPSINKKNYLRHYPFAKLHWDGHVNKPLVLTSTSGSTGDPVYFSRGHGIDAQYSVILQEYLSNSSFPQSSTLVVICFGMGIWIGGLITYQSYEIAARTSSLPISISTPGINKSEILKILKNLGPRYRQVVLVGYAPFIKEVLDDAKTAKISLEKMNLRFHFAAEAITEKYRDFLFSVCPRGKQMNDSINIYGSADIGAMAYEGPAGILLKRLALTNSDMFKSIFTDIEKTPTVAQYNPHYIQFESIEGEILLTGNNSMPLIRYGIGDHGGVFSFTEAEAKLKNFKVSLTHEARRFGVNRIMNKLPFVYIYERSDFSTTLYGINIYPEVIREGLLDAKIRKQVTGRFAMSTKFDDKKDQFLEINIESKKKNLKSGSVTQIIEKYLTNKSSEFKELKQHLHSKRLIRLKFWPAGHTQYFKPGVKQRWVVDNKT